MKSVHALSFSNQIPLFVRPSHKAPVVTLQVWVRTGSADERSNEAGLSHFIEHLVFKGTPSFKAGEIAHVVEEAGGELNAYTSFDQTVFYVTVPKEKLNVAAHVLSEMVSSPLFDATEVNNEREVVIEEIKMGKDQPNRVAGRMLFEQMFEGHPYSLPVIGTQENVERVTSKEIQDYFLERYVGQNMAVVCAGDVDPAEVQTLLDPYFKDIRFKPTLKNERSRKPRKLGSNRYAFQKSTFEKDHFYLSWPVKGYLDESSQRYELLSLILGQGESSFLYRKLRLEQNLCRSIGSWYYGSKEEGVFVVSGVAMPEQTSELLKALPLALKEFCEQQDLSMELQKARHIFASEQSYAAESISSQCRSLGDSWLHYNDIDALDQRREKILNFSISDICSSLECILSQSPYLSLLSKKEPAEAQSLLLEIEKLKDQKIHFEKSQSEPVSFSKKILQKQEHPHVWTTEKGRKAVFVPVPEGDVVSFKMAFEGGELLATDCQQGLVSLLGSTWGRSFKSLSEFELVNKVDFYCSDFSVFSGRHTAGLSLYTLNHFLPHLKDLVTKAFSEPVFDAKILERSKKTKLQTLDSLKDSPAQQAFRLLSKKLFEGTFYARDAIGTRDFLESCSPLDLETFLQNHLKQNAVFVVVGNLELAEVQSMISEVELILPLVERGQSLYGGHSISWTPHSQSYSESSEKNQSHIVLGYPGATYASKERLHLQMITALLGGQGGRLFIELRDKKSLAYSVAPLEHSAYYGGYFGSYIACDPSKKEEALSMMRRELSKTAENPITLSELEWIKNQLKGKQAMALQRNSSIADQVLFDTLYGLDPFAYKALTAELDKVTPQALQDTMQKVLGGPEVSVTVG